jgi:proline iminopeptidase
MDGMKRTIFAVTALFTLMLSYGLALDSGEFTAEFNGLRLWYKVSGEGPVCLMPNPAWGPSSELYFMTLQELEKTMTMVYLDCRGTGRSQRAANLTDYTWDQLIADLDALRAHLGQEKVWVAGHSEGGSLALRYAGRHPDRVNGLLIIDGFGGFDPELTGELEDRWEARRSDPAFVEAEKSLRIPPESDDELKDRMAKGLPIFLSDVAKAADFGEVFAATSFSLEAWKGQGESGRGGRNYSMRACLEKVEAPALIVVGADDISCSPVTARHIHFWLKNSKLLVIEKAGHFPWLEQPKIFFNDVRAFLALQMRSM